MIKERQSLSMAEAKEFIGEGERASETEKFIKGFTKLDYKKAKDLRAKLEGLNLMKLKTDSVSKIIDILPETSEDLNKIFVDIGLDEDETKKVLDTVKEFIK